MYKHSLSVYILTGKKMVIMYWITMYCKNPKQIINNGLNAWWKIAILRSKTNQQSHWREMEVSSKRKEKRLVKKRQSEDKNKNPEGRRVKEMESVKKERKSAAAVLWAGCVRPTPQSFLTLNPFPAGGGQLLPLRPVSARVNTSREWASVAFHTHTQTDTPYRDARYSEASVTGCHCKLIPNRY